MSFDSLCCFQGYNYQFVPSSMMKMSTVAASVGSEIKEGVRLLVKGGPKAQKLVGIWLFGSAAWVFSMVIPGGATRLTRSGLSMTDWKFTGGLPPLSDEDWLIEFEKYKQSPEYKIKGYITVGLGAKLCGLFALGAGQGLIGSWMEPASEYAQPRASPYRFAAHLTSAFAIYSGLFWTALSVVMPEPPTDSLAWVRGAAKVKKLALRVSLIVGITAISGAFVAGNDAGHAFNTFPKMGDTWIPDDIFDLKPVIHNFFENTSAVQLDHRILAITSLTSIGALCWFTRKLDIHPAVATVGMATLQVPLGISTLLSYVRVSLGTARQAGALTPPTLVILFNHTA
ncbi:hypothetical protein D5086_003960 [Populus alba]|uniref:Uncharacterized protein n=1 Tax=Populus alba TaxID=43335 RepID=A0ACC4D745_POPAL